MSTTSTELLPTNLTTADIALLSDPTKSLQEILDSLAIPAVEEPSSKVSAMPKPSKLPEKVQNAIGALQEVFAQVQPATRRKIRKAELEKLKDEKLSIAAIKKALSDREKAIAEIVSTHFDVVAEEEERATKDTPRDAKGHYRIASPGNPEIQEVEGSAAFWARQRSSDVTLPSQTLMEQLLALGEIAQEDVDLISVTVTQMVIDEAMIRQAIASEATRARVLALLKKISTTTPGTNSIYLR